MTNEDLHSGPVFWDKKGNGTNLVVKRHTEAETATVVAIGKKVQAACTAPRDHEAYKRHEAAHHAINADVIKRYKDGERIPDVVVVHHLVDADWGMSQPGPRPTGELNVFVYMDTFPTRRPNHRLRLRIDITKLEAGELTSIPVEYMHNTHPSTLGVGDKEAWATEKQEK